MHIYFDRLLNDLKKKFSVQEFSISSQVITGIEVFPRGPSGAPPPLRRDVAYICEYRKLIQYHPRDINAPIICVLTPGAEADAFFLHNRTVAVISSSSVNEVLTTLANLVYDYGLQSSQLTEISRALLKCKSFQELANEGCRILDNPIIVTDSNQIIRAYTDPEAISDLYYNELLSLERLPVGHPSIEVTEAHDDMLHIDSELTMKKDAYGLPAIVCKTLTAGGSVVGYLHIPQIRRDFEMHDKYIAELLGNLITAELLRRPEIRAPGIVEQQERFLRDILDNAPWSAEYMSKRQEEAGLKFKKYLYTIVLRARANAPSARISLYELVKKLAGLLPNCIGLLYKNSPILLFGADIEIKNFEEALSPILPELDKHGLIAGVSNMFSSMQRLRHSGFQCIKALQLGSILNKKRPYYLYRDYAVFYMIELSLGEETIEAFCSPELLRLIAHCKKHNSKTLLDTLRVYLKCGRSKSLTAKEMYTHLNTVKYRITQIQDILDFDLNNDENALKLLLSFKMLEYREAFPSNEPPLM